MNEIFNKYIDLKILLKYFHDNGIKLCIISFGNEKNIKYIIREVFGDIFDDIIGVGMKIPCFLFNAKNRYLEDMMKKYNYSPQEVLFFDDEPENITCAKKLNVHTHQNPITGVTPQMIIEKINNINYKHKYLKYKYKVDELNKK